MPLRAVASSFMADECLFLSGAVAYQIFFALIPVLALVVGVLAFVFGPTQAERQLTQLIRDFYPSATAQETRIARQLVDGRALSLGFGIVGTFFATTAVHSSIDNALAMVLGRAGKRGFVRAYVEAFAFVGGMALLAALSFAISYGSVAAQSLMASAGFGATFRTVLGFVSPFFGFLAGYVLFLGIYQFVPRARVPARSARLAALVSAVLWEAAKIAFAFFTRGLGGFTAYGPLAFAAGLLTWIYVTAAIVLIGAEVIKMRQAPHGTG